jgi:hypothetical protein
LENEGGVISSLDQQANPALTRRRRSRHDEPYHEALLPQSEIETEEYLFDNWFDPIEAGLRDRTRDFLQAMFEGELDEVLARSRYCRGVKRSRGGWQECVSPSIRELILDVWPELAHKLPPEDAVPPDEHLPSISGRITLSSARCPPGASAIDWLPSPAITRIAFGSASFSAVATMVPHTVRIHVAAARHS